MEQKSTTNTLKRIEKKHYREGKKNLVSVETTLNTFVQKQEQQHTIMRWCLLSRINCATWCECVRFFSSLAPFYQSGFLFMLFISSFSIQSNVYGVS